MEANELRIGNLITFKGDLLEVNIQNLIIIHGGGSDKLPFKPIPLTEGWLVKFGYRINKGVRNNYVSGFIEGLELIEGSGYWYLEHLCDGHGGIELGHFEYVHELQNFYFAAKRQELTIKEHACTV